MRLIFYMPLLLFFVVACHDSKPKDFFAKQEQPKTQRTVRAVVTPVDSLLLKGVGIFSPGRIRVSDSYIYISDFQTKKVTKLAKSSFKVVRSYGKKGRGPGEVKHLSSFDVYKGLLAVADDQFGKIIIYKTGTGEIEKETVLKGFLSHRIAFSEQGSIILFAPLSPKLFVVSPSQAGPFTSIGFHKKEKLSPLQYEGDLVGGEDCFYYAGYSESILKRISLDGKELFSVSTIDNYPSEANYVTATGTDQQMFSYAPGALFATASLSKFEDKLVVIPYLYDEKGDNLRLIDFYDTRDGSYLYSIKTRYKNYSTKVKEQLIYSITQIGDEFYLVMYPNKS